MIVAGFTLSFLTPIFQIPDEPAHFARAYQISEGSLIGPVELNTSSNKKSVYTYIPKFFFQTKYIHNLFSGDKRYSSGDIVELLTTPLDNTDTIKRFIHGTGQYTPLVYFPQALAAYIARSLGGTAGAVYYAMRLGSVLFVALCVFMSLRLLPEKGLLIFLLSMMPMFLAEAASVSADAVTYGVCILASAYLLSLTRDEEKLTCLQIFTILCLSAAVGLAKQVYGTVMLLYFLMPYKRLGSVKHYLLFGVVVLSVCLASSLTWTYIITVKNGVPVAMVPNEAAKVQMESFTANPLSVLIMCLKSNILSLKYFAKSFMGILGWLTLVMPTWFYVVYAELLIVGAVFGQLKISWWQRLIMFAGALASLIALDVYMYLTWYQTQPDVLSGLQGRYFIPLALMGFAAFSGRPRLQHEKGIALAAGLFSIIMTIVQSYVYFYC